MKVPRVSWIIPGGRSRMALVACAGLLAVGALANVVVHRVTALPEGSVLRVGDVTVSEDEFQQRVDVFGALYGAEQPPDGPKRKQFLRDAAQAVATSIIIDNAAHRRGVAVTQDDAQKALDTIIKQKFPQGRKQFNQALGNLGVSKDTVLTAIKRQLNASRVFDSVTKTAGPVSDAELRHAYDKRKGQLGKPEKRRLSNIVVDSQNKARNVREKAESGADFADLAARFSLDKSTAEKGGDLGLLPAAKLEPPVAKEAFATPAGNIYGPVKGRSGWNVGKVIKIRPATTPTFEQAKDKLREQLERERKLAIWRPWLTERIQAANVEYADQYRPDHPEALPPEMSQ